MLICTVSSGATVYMQFCMNRLVEVNVWDNTKKACDKCASDKHGQDCCELKHQSLKISKSFAADQNQVLLKACIALINQRYYIQLPAKPTLSIAGTWHYSNAPPAGEDIPLYLKNCTFRI
jgi:hypothetical protein